MFKENLIVVGLSVLAMVFACFIFAAIRDLDEGVTSVNVYRVDESGNATVNCAVATSASGIGIDCWMVFKPVNILPKNESLQKDSLKIVRKAVPQEI